jgi:L,D-transpeptidase YcbB
MVACTTTTKPPVASEPVRQTAIPLTVDEDYIKSASLNATATVNSFYLENEMRMVWMDTFQLQPDGDSLVQFVSESESMGLIPNDYHFDKIKSLLNDKYDHENAMRLDVCLTDAYLTLWHHLKNGRVNRKSFGRTKIDTLVFGDAIESLNNALAAHSVNTVLRDREPKLAGYAVLKRSLERILKQNLSDTTIAMKRDQLVANIERLRWETKIPDRYIAVNVPSYFLKVVERDSVMLESRVIIGKPETPTPNIRSVVNSFIIYPYWHVPRSILKEILPSIQQDTNYLKKHNYEVIDSKGKVVKNSTIDFKKYTPEHFPYVLRQREGSENTMGVIKFVFPNNYGVYLHDTNARRLFSKSDRALSHGCIRVQKAVDLAKYLANDDDTYVDAADLEQYLLVQKRMEIKVVRPIPVHLDYFTVQPQGDSVVFYKDIYKKDRALVDSLNRVKPPHPPMM